MKAARLTVFKSDLYPQRYLFVSCAGEKLVATLRKKHGELAAFVEQHYHPGLGGFCVEASDNTLLIWVDSAMPRQAQLSACTHEALHATFVAMRTVGVRLKKGSEEAFAYYHTWLTERLWSLL